MQGISLQQGSQLSLTSMKSQIISRLHDIEAEENVRIVYACESDKRAGAELDRGSRIEPLSRFIEDALDRGEKNSAMHQKRPFKSDKLDELFRATLIKAWDIQKSSRGKN